MRVLRVLAATVASVGLVLTALAAPAQAGSWDATYGDINGDKLKDRITPLGSFESWPRDACPWSVAYGKSGGGYKAAVTKTVSLAPYPGPCPDRLVVANLAGDSKAEIVGGWGETNSPRGDYGTGEGLHLAVVSSDFQVTGWYPGEHFLGAFGVKDFNGDGRMDIWINDTQDFYLSTMYGTASGGLAHGAVGLCDAEPGWYEFADLDGDGGTDIVNGQSFCDDKSDVWPTPADMVDGVVFVSGKTGTTRLLHAAETPYPSRVTGTIVDADRAGLLDIRMTELDWDGTEVNRRHLVNDGAGAFRLAPTAAADTATVHKGKGKSVTANVRGNDADTTAAKVAVTVKPKYGTATVLSDGRIKYVRSNTTTTTDTLTYQLTDDGRTSTAVLTIKVKK